jgi:GNAT superfamily N-acetyltransferase
MKKIEWVRVTPDSFEAHANNIMAYEEEYSEELRATREDVSDGISREGSVALLMYAGGECAGFALAYELIENEIYEYGLAGSYPHGAIYLESITVATAFRGEGLGAVLLSECARLACDGGFHYMVGHFRKNGSLGAARKLGMKELHVVPDWRGTGEPFVYGIIDLASLPTDSRSS